jgi:ketosteroid isomerase-like protein
MRSPLVLVLAASALASCSRPPDSTGRQPESTAVASATTPAAPVAAVAAGGIREPEVRELLQRWLKAQNDGDLPAYVALYADRFEGVRRTGERSVRLDRKGWVADRTKMFARKIAVEARDITIAGGAVAQVHFNQTWSSGTFQDTGPKAMVIVREKGALRVSREEMLKSDLERAKAPPAFSPDRFAFVIHDGGPRVVVREAPPADWKLGAPTLLADGGVFPTRNGVNLKKLPPELSSWVGRRLRLYGPGGPVCEADVTGLSIVTRVTPHSSEVARWHGDGTMSGEPSRAPLSKAEIAESAQSASESADPRATLLTAELGPPTGDCKTAAWAQAAGSPPAKVAAAEPADAATSAAAIAELRKLPAYGVIQATNDEKGFWDTRGTTVVSRIHAPGGKELVAVSADFSGECGGFQGSLWAMFELVGDPLKPRWQLLGKPLESAPALLGVLDAEGDGRTEVLFHEGLLRGPVGLDYLQTLAIPMLDCGC